MPKIDAPTVAEHHQRRRAALVAAALDLLGRDSPDAVTLAAVGAEAGLARSSVYQYFDSMPSLLAAVIEEAFPRATAELEAAVASAQTPQAQVEIYVATAIRLASGADHRAISSLASAGLPPACVARVVELHLLQQAPLRDALERLGADDPVLAATLVQGVIVAAARASDADPAAALAFLRHGLPGLNGAALN